MADYCGKDRWLTNSFLRSFVIMYNTSVHTQIPSFPSRLPLTKTHQTRSKFLEFCGNFTGSLREIHNAVSSKRERSLLSRWIRSKRDRWTSTLLVLLLLASFFLFSFKNFSFIWCVTNFMYLKHGSCVICLLRHLIARTKTYGVKVK